MICSPQKVVMCSLHSWILEKLGKIGGRLRKRTQLKGIKKGDEKFSSAFDHSSIGMALVSLEGKLVKVNGSLLKIFGYSETELLGKTFQEVTHVEDLKNDVEDIRRLLAGEISSYQIEKRCFNKSGAIIWVQLSVCLAHDEIGEPLLFISQIQDITKAKRSEDLLHISDIAFKSVSQGILITNAERLITSANPAFCRITGYSEEETLGKNCKFLQGELTDQNQIERMRSALRSGTDFSGEILNYRKDGSIFWNELSISPVHDEKGVLSHFVGIARDITEMRKSRETLLEKNALLSSIFKASNNGYMIIDNNKVRLYQNDQFNTCYGIPDEVASDSSCDTQLEWVAQNVKNKDDFISKAHEISSHPEMRSRDTIELKSGRILDRFTAPVLSDLGVCFGRILSVRDVTEEREREKVILEISEKAQSADRAKSEFLSVMSHELRTPLSGIIGFSRLMLDEVGLPGRVYDQLGSILLCGEGLLRTLDDIMHFTRAEGGRSDLQNEQFSLSEMAWESIRIVEPDAEAKRLTLSVVLDEKLPPTVLGDSGRIQRVLINLLRNAVKFTEHGGITLRLDLISKIGEVNRIEFSVSDTGCGVLPEQSEKIFLPFTQGDSTLSRKFGGVGLGLSISQALLLKMGSKITLESEEGKGAKFSFELDLLDAESTVSKKSEVSINAGSRDDQSADFSKSHSTRILAVEDNEIMLKILLSSLKSLGYQDIFSAINGEEAVRIFQQEQIDFIFMDLHLPVMDGITATKSIRALEAMNPSAEPAFIVALTANTSAAIRNDCFKAGINKYLSKPFNRRSLAEVLTSKR